MSCGPMTNTLDSAFWKERVASERKAQPLDENGIALPRERVAVAPCPWATEDIVMGVPPAYLKEAGASTKRAGSRTSSRGSSRATSMRSSRASKTSVRVRLHEPQQAHKVARLAH